MPVIDLYYPVLGTTLPVDHGYPLYTALARLVPAIHSPTFPVAVSTIGGQYPGDGTLRLDRSASLRLRTSTDHITTLLPLSGQALDIAGHTVRLGVPRVRPLVPASMLIARMVTIKGFRDLEPFHAAARRQLDELAIPGELSIPLRDSGRYQGQPRRQVMAIKGQRVVGFTVLVTGLTAEGSIALQEQGLGGRRRMGCGIFVPFTPRGSAQ